MAKFKVGDKVISIMPVGRKNISGTIGTIVEKDDHDKYHPYLVRFDQDIGSYIGLGSGCDWWCEPDQIELVEWNNNMFTKKDLKNGDVVKFKGGAIGVAIPEVNSVLFKGGQLNLDLLSDNMLYDRNHDYDIVAIRRPSNYEGCSFCAFENFKKYKSELVYERKEVEEMTLEEVCKALGKEIKIVK